ncbi:protein FAR-RED IMPAIRED RESPONSE 1-like [Fagus crenata]
MWEVVTKRCLNCILIWPPELSTVTDESFRIALDNHESTLNTIEAGLKNLAIEESTVGGTRFKLKAQQAIDSVQPNNCEGNKIKGIKHKGRQGTSRRRRGALERATRMRKRQNEVPTYVQELPLV